MVFMDDISVGFHHSNGTCKTVFNLCILMRHSLYPFTGADSMKTFEVLQDIGLDLIFLQD